MDDQHYTSEPQANNQSSFIKNNIPPFGNRPFQISNLSDTLKANLGPEFLSERAGPGGRKVPFLEGWRVVENANDVFHFNGWSSEIKSQKIDFIDSSDGRHTVGVSTIIRITLQDGSFREDVGVGLSENSRSKGDAIEKAKKSSVTDGIKRALRLFGNVMGLSLSSKEYIKNIRKIPNPSSKPFQSDNLYRYPEYLVRSKSELPPQVDRQSTASISANQPQRQYFQKSNVVMQKSEKIEKIETTVNNDEHLLNNPDKSDDTDYLFNDDDFADINLENYENCCEDEPFPARTSINQNACVASENSTIAISTIKGSNVKLSEQQNINPATIKSVNSHQANHAGQTKTESSNSYSAKANVHFTPNFQKSSTLLGTDPPLIQNQNRQIPNIGFSNSSNTTFVPNKRFQPSLAPNGLSSGNLPPRRSSHAPLKAADNRSNPTRKFDQMLNNPSNNKRPYPEGHNSIF